MPQTRLPLNPRTKCGHRAGGMKEGWKRGLRAWHAGHGGGWAFMAVFWLERMLALNSKTTWRALPIRF